MTPLFITASAAAEIWSISPRRVRVLASEGRIPGATKIGRDWMIPADAAKPTDPRIRK